MSLCTKECSEQNNVACTSCGARFRNRGRPQKTAEKDGFKVSCSVSKGRPCNTRRRPEFDNSIQLPADWDHSNELVNVDDELLDVCARRIA